MIEKNSERKAIFITGGSRGLGLEFTKQYLKMGHRVFTGSRKFTNSQELSRLKTEYEEKLEIYQLDVGKNGSRDQFYQRVSEKTDKLDILINNAGIISGNEKSICQFGELDQEHICKTLLVNSVAPLMITEKFYPLLRKGKRPVLVNITSSNGSIIKRNQKGKYGYCTSKAALNMITKILSIELRDSNILAIALHPGWVKTSMTAGENAPMEPFESIIGMIEVINSLEMKDSGKFLDWQGKEIPW
jgi:NAD(P)-dependent dehydrogenase (short-subunit alcohol dehydrogenase family)